mmetsp:Transcript_128925/g.251077  ORF Transcript_128925/g.251077 Transcript_128925/m.251077 type:complete len:236 (-) Transcript_128925:278-985(-)
MDGSGAKTCDGAFSSIASSAPKLPRAAVSRARQRARSSTILHAASSSPSERSSSSSAMTWAFAAAGAFPGRKPPCCCRCCCCCCCQARGVGSSTGGGVTVRSSLALLVTRSRRHLLLEAEGLTAAACAVICSAEVSAAGYLGRSLGARSPKTPRDASRSSNGVRPLSWRPGKLCSTPNGRDDPAGVTSASSAGLSKLLRLSMTRIYPFVRSCLRSADWAPACSASPTVHARLYLS